MNDDFRQVVERWQRAVFAVAFAILGDRALAEDVAQEAFVAAWRQWRELRERGKVGPWVVGIARNLAHNALRRRTRRGAVQVEPEAPAPRSPLEDALAQERDALLVEGLGQLREEYREPLILYYLEGRSVPEVAELVGLGEEATRQRLSRGRKALRAVVAERFEEAARALAPSAGFVSAVAAAVAVASREAAAGAAAGKVVMSMSLKKLAIAIGAGVVLAAGAAVVAGRATHSPASSLPARGRVAPPPAPLGTTAPRPAPGLEPPSGGERARRLESPTARAQLLARIRSARGQRTSNASGSVSGPAPQAHDDADKDYIRQQVRAILPLLAECHEHALEKTPDLAGKIVVHFTIEGEPDVGGVIGESRIQEEGTTIRDPALRECVQETMYAVEIDPPASGGIVEVTYPFAFSPGD